VSTQSRLTAHTRTIWRALRDRIPARIGPQPSVRVIAALAALALSAAGLAGAYSYAQDYNLHRGFATIVPFRRAGTGRLEEVHFYSRALRRMADYLVYLPPHYSPAQRYPVYYLLHGAPGKPRVFVDIANMDVRLDNQMSLGRARPMILVYPDGRIDGSTFSDSEWANTPSGDFESYVINVVDNVDQRFAAIPRRQDRVIAGFSAGAYGAMNIALHHLALFANVQSWSGYYIETRSGVFAHASRATLAYNSPLYYVSHLKRALHRYPLRAYMFVGRDDPSASQQVPMARALARAGAEVSYRFYPGGHDWSVWYPRLNQMIDLASSDFRHPPRPQSGALSPRTVPAARPQPLTHHERRASELRLLAALLLALLSAALINLGFVMQHRGHDRARRQEREGLSSGFRQPIWLAGQLTGWVGFAGQIVAVALAPLTLVQAFSAGSLALSVPLAARLFGQRVTRAQLGAIVAIALALATLPLGFGTPHEHLRPGLLIGPALLLLLAAGLLAPLGGPAALAVAAGVLYGEADGAIKAASLAIRLQDASALAGWVLLAAICTLGGFLAFQAALRGGDAVRPLSLMNAFTALMAIAVGAFAFGEQLGASPAAGALHAVAILVVLVCVRPLAGAQQRLAGEPALERADVLADVGAPGQEPQQAIASAPIAGWLRATHVGLAMMRRLGVLIGGFVAVLISVLSAIGLLYGMRQLRLFALGPRVPDALPLLQLAGFASQPLSRVMAAALLAGLAPGVALARVPRGRRVLLVGVCSLLLLLIDSDASYALAHNLRFSRILLGRMPGPGPWLEALLVTATSAWPGRAVRVRAPTLGWAPAGRRARLAMLAGAIAAVGALALAAPGGHAGARPASGRTRRVAAHPILRSAPRRDARSAPGGAPAVRLLALDRLLSSALERAQVASGAPAATAAVVRCGTVLWAGASGVAALRSGTPATNATLFVLNSAAKTIIATMTMQEVQAGRLSLDTRLSAFYPWLPDASQITVEMLLNMTSGLPEYLDNHRIQWLIRNRPRHHWTVDQILTSLGSGLGYPAFVPGTRYQYSDTNYIALGAILERITHSSIQQDFQRLIGTPLGITSATFIPTPAAKALIAHPYLLHPDGRLTSLWVPGYGVSSGVWGPVFTDGGMAASSLELARIANALFAGRLVDVTELRQMTHLGRGHYGLGLQRRRFGGRRWLGHIGIFGGYGAEDWTDPARQLTIAVATNAQRTSGGHYRGLISDVVWKAIARVYDRHAPPAPVCTSPL
jgi:CubicO group peptidase (beta-lactamase class C family)/enterochelin esterase-like enzyme